MANPTPTKAPRAEQAETEIAERRDPEPEPEPEACPPSPAKSYQASPAKQVTPQKEELQHVEPWPISTFVVGGPVIILSPKLKWRECTVVELEPNGTVYQGQQIVAEHVPCIKVNYVGFNQAFDEWLCLAHDSNRIRPAATRAAAKLRAGLGELSPNQRLQEHKKAEVCLPWLSNSPVKPMASLK
jgi:hypothetical protein